MSLASEYADACAVSRVGLGEPAAWTGENGRAEITPRGELRLVNSSRDFDISVAELVALRRWLALSFD